MRICACILVLFLLTACSVTKRRYQPGYHLEALHRTQEPCPALSLSVSHPATKREAPQQSPVTAAQKIFSGDSTRKKCDAIFYKDGTEDSVLVTEVGVREIKFRKCGMQDGPLFVCRRSEVFMIRYAGGFSEVLKDIAPEPPAIVPSSVKKPRKDGLAITSFVLSVLGILPFTFTGSVLAILYGVIYLRDNPEKENSTERTLAKTGIIIGAFTICLVMAIILLAGL